MLARKLSIPEILLIAGTRVALGHLSKDQRQAAGLALTLVGALTTIPLAITVIGRKSEGGLEQAA